MGRGSFQYGARARGRGAALPWLLAIAGLALTAGCGPRIKTSEHSFGLYRPDGAGAPTAGVTLVDLRELFLSEERILYAEKEIPARFEEVRVLTIDGAKVPEGADYGEIPPGRHVFRLMITTTFHQIAEQSLTISKTADGRTLETQELAAQRQLTLHLRPQTLVSFGRDGRHAVEPLSTSVFGPEGACRREGARDRLCHRCTRSEGTANCVRELHYDFFEEGG